MKVQMLWQRFMTILRGEPVTLRTLGYPSYEDLNRIGMSRTEFHAKYIAGTSPRGCRTPQQFAQKVLSRF